MRLWVLVASCLFGVTAASWSAPTVDAPPVWGDVAKLVIKYDEGTGSCSGWMFTADTLITAGHCTEDLVSADACFYPDFYCETPVRLTLVGANLVSDVAAFRLPPGVLKKPMSIRTTPLTVGEDVLAVGHPFAEFTISKGVYARRHPRSYLWFPVWVEWLQHSAATFTGSSGGALLDADGSLVGMTIGGHTIRRNGYQLEIEIASPIDVILLSIYQIEHAENTQ